MTAALSSPVEQTVVSTGGARLHVEIHGAPSPAPTVVLSHGWTCNTTFWHQVVRRLAADHRVVLYDQRGHGRTPRTPGSCGTEELADDFCAVLEATTEPGTAVVAGGHSMGAMTIVAAAGREIVRERVAAAMLCSTGMGRLPGEAKVAPLRSVRLRRRLHTSLLASPLPLGPVNPMGSRVLHYVTLGPDAPAEVRAEVARMVHACPRRTRAEWGRVLGSLALMDRLPELTMPTVVVHGTEDRLTPPVHAHRMSAALPGDDGPLMLPGLGHMTPMEDPDRISEVLRGLVRDHLAGTEAAASATVPETAPAAPKPRRKGAGKAAAPATSASSSRQGKGE